MPATTNEVMVQFNSDLNNNFFETLENLYESGRNKEILKETLGRARAKRGMFEGDLQEGELEIGQVSALINEILPVEKVFENLLAEFNAADFTKF